MQIIILAGGAGSRLWPLSNDARSKQFLKLLPKPNSDEKESMVQRVVRQLRESGFDAEITVTTNIAQRDAVVSQLGDKVNIVTEPSRRRTFPAICLACEYLLKAKGCSENETALVLPCDPFTEEDYFKAIEKMVKGIDKGMYDLTLMGIAPAYPTRKYGYVLTESSACHGEGILPMKKFVSKPDVEIAETLIEEGALWNGGVFAFRLGYMGNLSDRYMRYPDYSGYMENYNRYPVINFDREVLEKATNVGIVPFKGYWKDLGTWDTLTDEIKVNSHGNVITDETGSNTHIFNELNLPLLCIGTDNLLIAASPDGILVTEKSKSENVKKYASDLKGRPMYEDRRWGTYKVIDYVKFPDGFQALTKQLTLNPGSSISYQRHNCRDEVWTFIEGEGYIVLDGEKKKVGRGDVINIPKRQLHALKATTSLTFIEVQHGSNLVEEDIERFDYDWD